MKNLKKNKAITLIALVITIIILLILAGVTTYILINKGIMDKSKTAVDEYKISEYKDNIEVIKTGEHIKKISDKLSQSLKNLVVDKLESKENESWVKKVETIEEDEGLEEDQIKVYTQDQYIIIAEIEEDGTITYISIEKDNGEPYPSLAVEVLPLEGTENEKVKIQVKAEVEKIGKTKKIAKIELIKDGITIETRSYNDSKVEDIFEVEENGTYRMKAITDQEKSTSKKAIINIQGTENIIEITSEPATSRNTESTGIKNGVATGLITVTITYGETELQKQYKVGTGEWQTVSGTSTQIQVSENTSIVAKYYDGKNSFKATTYNIQNVDNVEPTFTNYNVTTSGTTITATATVTDTASEGAASGIAGVEIVKYSIDGTNYQTTNTFTISTPGEYTVYIKAIDKAGNETIVNKTVNITIYKLTYDANGGTGAPEEVIRTSVGMVEISTQKPSKSGAAFVGWSTSPITGSVTTSVMESLYHPRIGYQVDGSGYTNYPTGSEINLNRNITLYAVWLNGEYELSAGYGYSTYASDNSGWIEKTFEIVVPRYVNINIIQGKDYMTIGSPSGTQTVYGSCYGTHSAIIKTSGKTYGTISGLRGDFKKIVVTYNANPSTQSGTGGVVHYVYTHKITLKLN